MKKYFLIIVIGVVFIGCAVNSNGGVQTSSLARNFENICIQNNGKVGDKSLCYIGGGKIRFNSEGIEVLSSYGNKYGKDGFDQNGYNFGGWNQHGYNKFGLHNSKFEELEKYLRDICIDKNGKLEWDREIAAYTCNIEGKIIDCLNNKIDLILSFSDYYDKDGYSKDGYDREGFSKNGIHKDTQTLYAKNGYSKEGYDKNGFNVNELHKDTSTKYDKNGKNKDGLTQQEQMQKDYYDKMLAIEKEKLELEKQKLAIQKQQANATQEDASTAEINRSLENLNNQLNYNNQQMLNRMNTYKVKVVKPYGY